MAVIFVDGFDHYSAVDALKKWTLMYQFTYGIGQQFDIRPEYARQPGGMGVVLGGGGDRRAEKNLPASYATMIAGFNAYFTQAGGSGGFFAFIDAGSEQISLRRNSSGNVLVSRAGTTLATSSNLLSLNTWYHFEIRSTIHNTTGAYEVRVNGSSTGWIPSATSQNTRGTGSNNSANGVRLWAQDGIWYCDDFYVLDTTGSVSNDFVGPQKIITLYPNAVGNYSQWTGNYASNFVNVNETTGDSDTTFNQSSTVNQIDSFVYDDIPSGTVSGIQHVLLARQDAGTQRAIAPLQRSSGTDYVGTAVNLPGSHLYILESKTLNPATSAQWSASEVNSAEFGYKLTT